MWNDYIYPVAGTVLDKESMRKGYGHQIVRLAPGPARQKGIRFLRVQPVRFGMVIHVGIPVPDIMIQVGTGLPHLLVRYAGKAPRQREHQAAYVPDGMMYGGWELRLVERKNIHLT